MFWFSQISCPVQIPDSSNFTSKSFENCTYYSNSEYSLAVFNNTLKYINIFPGGSLPFGLDWTDNNVQIVTKLGEPDRKISSKALGIEITYERLGLSIEFYNFDWNDLDNKVKAVVIFQMLREKDFCVPRNCKICAGCAKIGGLMCGRCKMFNYCSKECQVKHWAIHKEQCKLLVKNKYSK